MHARHAGDRAGLRPGGELRFLETHPPAIVCSPESGANVDDRFVQEAVEREQERRRQERLQQSIDAPHHEIEAITAWGSTR